MEKGAAALLEWFVAQGRDLPWRTPFPRDPYRVLVAEVMLQQTQVDRVLPLYRRFLERFPTLQALADADLEAVLEAWSGLGYYRRGRTLHAAARAIAAAGRWPRRREELLALPGLGPYTAAALAAFAFAGEDPPVDGNVARVAARVLALDAPVGSHRLLAAAEEWGRQLYRHLPRPELWEALMDLGARLCRPLAPACGECPLAPHCQAFQRGQAAAYPVLRPRRRRETHRWVALWLTNWEGRVLVRRVQEGQVLGGLWLPPFTPLGHHQAPAPAAAALLAEVGGQGQLRPAPSVTHSITFRTITVLPFIGRCRDSHAAEMSQGLWVDPQNPGVPTSSLTRKLFLACPGTPGG